MFVYRSSSTGAVIHVVSCHGLSVAIMTGAKTFEQSNGTENSSLHGFNSTALQTTRLHAASFGVAQLCATVTF